MLFNEFLIQKKLVTAEQILAVVMEHLKQVPSIAELIYEHSLISKTELLKILNHQQSHGSSFQVSATALGLWSHELANKIQQALVKHQLPIGEALVAKGHLSLASLTAALDGFVDANSKDIPVAAAVTLDSASSPKPKTELKAPSAPKLDEALAQEYAETFENNIRPKIQGVLARLYSSQISSTDLESALRSAITECIATRAAANFLGAKQSEAIANALMQLLTKDIKIHDKQVHPKDKDIFKLGFNLLEQLTQSIKLNHSEENILFEAQLSELNECFWQAIAAVKTRRTNSAA